jgi:AraC-like DNA-binding protein
VERQTATVIYVRSLVPVVEAAGMPPARFLELLGIDGDRLLDIDGRVPKEVVARAWDIAAQVTKNDSLGLQASLHAPPGTFPVLDHIAANQPCLGDALASMARYCRLCDDELCMTFDRHAAGATVRLAFPSKEARYSRHWAEWFVGLLVSRARTLSGSGETGPSRVTFQHGAPEDLTEMARVLGCTPQFDCPSTSVSFDEDLLGIRIQNASAFLSRIVLKHAESDLEQFGPAEPFAASAGRALKAMLAEKPPTIKALALRFRCSVRTLQARLAKENTSYADVLDDVRRDLALQYANDHNVRIMELSLLLRFSDASSFYRAFKRWTGTTPLEYRGRSLARRPVGDAVHAPRP